MSTAQQTGPASQDDVAALFASLTTPEVSADPYPVFARLRELGRLHRVGPVTYAPGYEECATVTREHALFLAQSPRWIDTAIPGWREHPSMTATFETMLFQDPPDHTRLRRLVSAAFTPRQAERMRASVGVLVERCLDALADAGADGGTVNLHAVVAATLPIAVIGSLVGVPASDWAGLQRSMSALLQLVEFSVSRAQLAAADEAALTLRGYFADLVASRRARPRDDLASQLVAVRDASAGAGRTGEARTGEAQTGEALTGDELLQTLTFLFMAGVDTMINLLAGGAAALAAHPDQAALLRADPGLAGRAAEEVLRFDPPVQFVGRVPARDTTLAGTPLPAGQLVMAMLGSANRDPRRFGHPDTFDITRAGTAVLSFGGGVHFCLGAPLARVEASTFLPALVTRFPALRPAGPPVRQGVIFRGFRDLPVTLK